jgi:hypothetical protein
MNTTEEQTTVAVLPELAVPNAERAISLVNGWLQRKIGTAVHVSQATYRPATYSWHLPVLLAYPDTGPVGVIGDVFVHAVTGQFVGLPEAEELKRRALALAEARGLIETDEDE